VIKSLVQQVSARQSLLSDPWQNAGAKKLMGWDSVVPYLKLTLERTQIGTSACVGQAPRENGRLL
jgi:hypothetical protein